MNQIVADTHAAIWYLLDKPRLGAAGRAALDAADQIFLPSICVVETIYLVEKGRLLAVALHRLVAELTDPTAALTLVPLDLDIAQAVTQIPRAVVPDLPDRIMAATALHRQLPLVSRDRKIQLSSVTTIW